MVIFVWGASVFFAMARPPAETLNIYVVGKQWMWKFQHLNGAARDQRAARAGRPRREADHDVRGRDPRSLRPGVPRQGRRRARAATRRSGSRRPSRARYHLFCAEYCGTQHSGMIGQVVVMEPTDYQAWLSERRAGRLARVGRRASCSATWRATPATAPDAQGRGPALHGLFGKTVTLAGRRRRSSPTRPTSASRSSPRARSSRPGFQPVMPTFQGQVSEEGAAAAHRVHQVAQTRRSRAGRPDRRPGSGERPITPRGHSKSCQQHVLLPPRHYLNDGYGVRSWLLTRDHKRIALLYLVGRHVLLLPRRRLRGADPPRAGDAGRRPGDATTPTTSCSRCTA